MLDVRLGLIERESNLVEDHLHGHKLVILARVIEFEQLEEVGVAEVLLERTFV